MADSTDPDGPSKSDVQELTYSIGILTDEISRLVSEIAGLRSSLRAGTTVVHERAEGG